MLLFNNLEFHLRDEYLGYCECILLYVLGEVSEIVYLSIKFMHGG